MEKKSIFMHFMRKIIKPKCKHVWKTSKIEYLYSTSNMWNAGASIEIDNFDVYAHYQECLVCPKYRIIKKNELVPYPKTKPV